MDIQHFAKILDDAAHHAKPVKQISTDHPFSEDQAYEIQKKSIDARYQRGEKFVGVKLGFTSLAKMQQMGVNDMIWGRLTDAMQLKDGETLVRDKFIHPRAEPEIAFKVKRAIDREISEAEIPDYIDGIAAAVEIIDSRYENFKFSLEDVIADNCSSAAFVIGEWKSLDTGISNISMSMIFDGATIQEGSSDAILGNPLKSILAASRLTNKYGQIIPADSIILAGAATPAMYLTGVTNVQVQIEALGNITFFVS